MNRQSRKSSSTLAVAIVAVLSQDNSPPNKSRDLLTRLTALGLLLGSSVSAASTYYVTTSGDPGPVGTTSLRQAVAQANDSVGNTVAFDASLIGSTITLVSGEIGIGIGHSITITGPGANRLAISGNDSSRIFHYSGTYNGVASITISGLTLTHGVADQGGAIYCYGGNLSLLNSVVTANKAYYGGGVSLRGGGYAYLGHSRISENYGRIGGGGVFAYYERGLGVNTSTISNNTTNGYGGGISAKGVGKMIVEYSLVSGNTVFAGNPQYQGGGGIAVRHARTYATFRNSTISGNSTYGAPGGGIGILDDTSADATACLYSTVAGNYSGGGAGNGIYALGRHTSLESCIVANNTSRVDSIDVAGEFLAQYSLIQTPGDASFGPNFQNIFNLDPQLSPLADHGGPTLTMLPAATSPVIDTAAVSSDAFDQRGAPRPAGSGRDMGAVERQYPEDLVFRNGFDPP